LNPRIFTLDEATRALERDIKPALERLYANIEDLQSERRRGMILGLVVDSGADAKNPDRAAYARTLDRVAALQAEMRQQVDRIQRTGAIFRDLRQGLVDFHAEIDGQLVCLCWQRGEETIAYWHPLDAGYAARRPIPERAGELDDV